MAGIFPDDGREPGDLNRGVPLTIATENGCTAKYYDESCPGRIDMRAMNALISEIVSVINAAPGMRYDCGAFDNLLTAIQAPPVE